jgi:hypothetical protein
MNDKQTASLIVDGEELRLLRTAMQEYLFSTDRHEHRSQRMHALIQKIDAAEKSLTSAP